MGNRVNLLQISRKFDIQVYFKGRKLEVETSAEFENISQYLGIAPDELIKNGLQLYELALQAKDENKHFGLR